MGGGASKRPAVAASHVPVPAVESAAPGDNLPAPANRPADQQSQAQASTSPAAGGAGTMAAKVAACVSLPDFKDWYLMMLKREHQATDHQVTA